MSSQCTEFSQRTVRLREAQRAFWLAWKAVSAGDRGALQEARRAQDALARVRFDIMRLMEVSWDASRFAVMEEKMNYRLAERYTNPQCLPGRWVELPDGKILEYAENKFTIWVRGHKGRYRAERFVDEPNKVQTLHAIGNNQFIVGYVDTSPWMWRMDDRGEFVCDHRIATMTLGPRIQRVGHLSDGRVCLTTRSGMLVLESREGKFVQVRGFFMGASDMPTAVHTGDVIVSVDSGPPAPRGIVIRTPDARGTLTVRAELPLHPLARYEYQPDGRLIEYDSWQGTVRCYQDDEEGTYALTGHWNIARQGNVHLLKTMQMLSYDRMLIVSGGSAEVWRLPFGSREATLETSVKFSGLSTDEYVLPNGCLVSVNEEEERNTMDPITKMKRMMRIRTLNDRGQYDIVGEVEQTSRYDSVTLMPDGRIFVRTQNKELLVFDGDSVESRV